MIIIKLKLSQMMNQEEKVVIDKYLVSNCLFIIDEFNERYCNIENDKLKEIANEEYSEADLEIGRAHV